MGNPNILPSDRARVMGVIDPDVTVASTVATGWIAAEEYANFMSVVMGGTLGASATLDAKLEQATSSGGAGAKDITGKLITQLTQAGTDSDKQAIINLRPDELDTANDFTHFRLSVTVAVATSDVAAIVFGFDARYEPETDATSVDEIVS